MSGYEANGAPATLDEKPLGGPPRVDRRTTIKWVLAACASTPLLESAAFRGAIAATAKASGVGYGTDPDLRKSYSPGELWPLTLSPEQRRTAAVLCDVILPADARSPSASAVGVVDFIDEWISAPYPQHQQDRALVVAGLEWLDAEARQRFAMPFAGLNAVQQTAICDDICYLPRALPAFTEAAKFFARFRDLTAGGFYTTPAGNQDLQYVGNTPLASFEGPPREVLEAVGLTPAQESKA